MNSLFFDARRYDLSRFGRYKMNQKLALAKRIAGHVAARDIIAPLTGELLAAAGEKVSKETAAAAEAAGVSLVYLTVDGKEVTMFLKVGDKVITSKYSGTEVKVDGQEYTIVRQSDVLAVVE